MKFDHAAMYADDLELIKDFYVKYFGAKPNGIYHNPKTGLKTYFLSFEDGGRLEIMKKPEVRPCDKDREFLGYAHIALNAGGKEKVDEITARLEKDGYAVLSHPRVTGDGYYESCIYDPEGNRVEITG